MYHALTNDTPIDQQNGKARPDLKLFYNAIDKKHFFNFDSSEFVKQNIKMQQDNRSSDAHRVKVDNKDYVQSHFEFCAMKGWTKSPSDGHPSERGHHEWGKMLHGFVKANNLI
jgi:hypothetical protein